MVSHNKSQAHSYSSIQSCIITQLQNSNLHISSRTKPFSAPFNVFEHLITTRYSKNANKSALLLDSLQKAADESSEFPSWVYDVADEDEKFMCFCAEELLDEHACLFMLYACSLSSLSVTLHRFDGEKMDCVALGATSIDHSHWLLHNGKYYMLEEDLEAEHNAYKKKNSYNDRIRSNESEDRQHFVSEKHHKHPLFLGNKNKNIVKRTTTDDQAYLKDKNSRSMGSGVYKQEPWSYTQLSKPKSNGFLNEWHENPWDQQPAPYRNTTARPLLKYSNALSNLQNVNTNAKLLTNDANVYHPEDKLTSNYIKKSINSNLVKQGKTQNNEEPCGNSSDDFEKAVKYIAVYQQRFRRTLKSMAKGKVCELKSEDVSKDYYEGYLKFYSEKSKFGFVKGEKGEEIFLHKDNLIKSRIDSQMLECCSQFFDVLLKYQILSYKTKGQTCIKAVNIEIINFIPRQQEE